MMNMRRAALALAFIAPAALAAGCATNTDAGATSVNQEDYIGAAFTSTAKGEPFLEFAEDGTYSGSDGCNKLAGTYEVGDDELVLKPGFSTLMACDGVDTWVRGATAVKVETDTLVVFDKSGSEIGTLARA